VEPVDNPRVFSNRYELTHLIARGGMAQVYRARDRLLDRPVAIKVLFPELSVDRAFVERFRREAQAAANLSHPNIVPVFDWGEDGGTYFIVMEFIDGEPLSAVLRASGPLPPPRVVDIGVHVAAALAYAHRHGVIHRDVKPGNVLITSDGQVKVTDFGIARAVNTEESLTQTGAVMGTATYFSPEQAEGIGVDSRSDIYSLGVVLYEMVAGRPPFLGDTPVAVASKHVRDQPPLLRDLAPSVPPALEAVIMKAMAKSPDQRYSTADELRADLERFAERRPVVAGDPEATQLQQTVDTTGVIGAIGRTQAVPPVDLYLGGEVPQSEDEIRRKRTRRLAALLVVLLIALAVIVFFLVKDINKNTSFAMPNVVGQQVAKATSALEQKGLTVGTKERSNPKTVGTVLSTTPPAARSVKKGQHVILTVSSGIKVPPKVVVPSVVGTSLTNAEAILKGTGLKYRVVPVASTKVTSTVIAQMPAAGKSVRKGTVVVLSVPKSSTKTPVPDVTGQTAVQAGVTLGAHTLKAGATTSQCSNTFGKGLVSATTPAIGTQVTKGSSVALTVSTGPCQAPVPNVTGMTQAAAKATLTKQGFTDVVSNTTPSCSPTQDGNVVDQNPSGGTSSSTSSQVTIAVCSAPTPTTTTPTTTTPTTTTPTTTPPPTTTTTT